MVIVNIHKHAYDTAIKLHRFDLKKMNIAEIKANEKNYY